MQVFKRQTFPRVSHKMMRSPYALKTKYGFNYLEFSGFPKQIPESIEPYVSFTSNVLVFEKQCLIFKECAGF